MSGKGGKKSVTVKLQVTIPSPGKSKSEKKPKASKAKPKTAGLAKPASAIQKKKKTISKTVTTTVEKKRCQHTKKTGAQCGNAVTKGNKKFCNVHSQKKAGKQNNSSPATAVVPHYSSPSLLVHTDVISALAAREFNEAFGMLNGNRFH